MHRFRTGQIPGGETISISNTSQIHHLKDVLRLMAGDEITVFDDTWECRCTIEHYDRQEMMLRINSRQKISQPKIRVTVACALPKKGMDEIIDKLTQLGVDTIIPMQTERVVVKLDEKRDRVRVGRWRRLAQSAAEQSQRSSIPEVKGITEFGDVIAGTDDYDLKLIPNLEGVRKRLGDVIDGFHSGNILVLIGPEGDFTPEEVKQAVQAGFIPVSLGSLVLRVDTAAVAAAAYIRMAIGI
jgi:16S rRNA (uracil1498-N3)-methyltransferase